MGPFCVAVRAEREFGNENLPGAPQGSLCTAVRAGRGGADIDNTSNGGWIKRYCKGRNLSAGLNLGATSAG
eukprot:13099748-Alexandrium_andersonii.AAC.1